MNEYEVKMLDESGSLARQYTIKASTMIGALLHATSVCNDASEGYIFKHVAVTQGGDEPCVLTSPEPSSKQSSTD